MEITFLPTNTSKLHLHVEQLLQNTYRTLAEDLRLPKKTPSGDLHTEVGPNPKLNPRSCANKEEKGKSLPAASGAAD